MRQPPPAPVGIDRDALAGGEGGLRRFCWLALTLGFNWWVVLREAIGINKGGAIL